MNTDQAPPGSQIITYKCKICGRDGATFAPPEASDEAIAKWAPMLTHNVCYDRYHKYRRAIAKAVKAANVWGITMRRKTVKPEARRTTENILEQATREFAEAIAEQNGRTETHWDTQITEQIMDKPHLVKVALGVFERYARKLHHENNEKDRLARTK